MLIDADATANTVKCSGNVDVKIYGCLTSLLVEQPNDANITVDCTENCFGCRCDSTPTVEVKGPGTCGEVVMTNCEVQEGASAQDILLNEVTITGGVMISDFDISDAGFQKLDCVAPAKIILEQSKVHDGLSGNGTTTGSHVSIGESTCEFLLQNVVLGNDVTIESCPAVTMDGVVSLESFKLFNIADVDLVNTTVNQVEIIECINVVLRESCFVEGLSVEKNSVVSLQDTFAGGVITCKDNQFIEGIYPNTAYVEEPSKIDCISVSWVFAPISGEAPAECLVGSI